jgi:signal peptidase II
MKKATAIVLAVLIIDQFIKVWIKTNMYIGQTFPFVGDYFQIHFIENNGMAFGLELFGGVWGKYALSIFRIIAVSVLGFVLYNVARKDHLPALTVSMALIFSGALGNILDSVFYGLIFEASHGWPIQNVAVAFPDGGGYAPFLQGKVVDMFHFNVFWPDWIPYLGGSSVFPPVFNFADAAISIGVGILVVLVLKKKV